jgi:hypothetical protein
MTSTKGPPTDPPQLRVIRGDGTRAMGGETARPTGGHSTATTGAPPGVWQDPWGPDGMVTLRAFDAAGRFAGCFYCPAEAYDPRIVGAIEAALASVNRQRPASPENRKHLELLADASSVRPTNPAMKSRKRIRRSGMEVAGTDAILRPIADAMFADWRREDERRDTLLRLYEEAHDAGDRERMDGVAWLLGKDWRLSQLRAALRAKRRNAKRRIQRSA